MQRISNTQLLVEGIAPGADLILGELSWLPIIGPAIGVMKTIDDFRNRILATKLHAFLRGLGSHSSQETEAMVQKLGDANERAKIGEVLFLTIDRYTDLDKCELLGRLVFACCLGLLTAKEVRRLAMAIDGAFPDDLHEFLEKEITFTTPAHPFLHHLEKAGLTDSGHSGSFAGIPSSTPLGQRMKDALAALPHVKVSEKSKRYP